MKQGQTERDHTEGVTETGFFFVFFFAVVMEDVDLMWWISEGSKCHCVAC